MGVSSVDPGKRRPRVLSSSHAAVEVRPDTNWSAPLVIVPTPSFTGEKVSRPERPPLPRSTVLARLPLEIPPEVRPVFASSLEVTVGPLPFFLAVSTTVSSRTSLRAWVEAFMEAYCARSFALAASFALFQSMLIGAFSSHL